MDNFAPAPCISEDGIEARISGSLFSVLTLIEVRNRLSANPDAPEATPEVLHAHLDLSLSQVYAALAYYHANQTMFDAELIRRQEASQDEDSNHPLHKW